MTEDALMPRTLTVALVPRFGHPAEPDVVGVELAHVRRRIDDLEWRVDWLEAELAAEREQRRELEVELRSVRRLVDDGIIRADRRRRDAGRLPACGDRRGEYGRRDTPPPSTSR